MADFKKITLLINGGSYMDISCMIDDIIRKQEKSYEVVKRIFINATEVINKHTCKINTNIIKSKIPFSGEEISELLLLIYFKENGEILKLYLDASDDNIILIKREKRIFRFITELIITILTLFAIICTFLYFFLSILI
jgi:hypothetical protein